MRCLHLRQVVGERPGIRGPREPLLPGSRKSSRRMGARFSVRKALCQAGRVVEGLIKRLSDITTRTRRLDGPLAEILAERPYPPQRLPATKRKTHGGVDMGTLGTSWRRGVQPR